MAVIGRRMTGNRHEEVPKIIYKACGNLAGHLFLIEGDIVKTGE